MDTFLQQLSREHSFQDEVAQAQGVLEDTWAQTDPFRFNNRYGHAGLGPAANDLLIQTAMTHTARPGSRRHGDLPPFYRTEMQHWEIVDAARVLEGLCPTAVNILDVLTQFCIFTGFDYKVIPRDSEDHDKELVKKAQRVIEDWMTDVDWASWEVELFRRSRRDGEAFLVLEEDELSGLFSLRAVEPEQIREPQEKTYVNSRLRGIPVADRSWKYGILTEKINTSLPLAYWVVSQYAEEKSGDLYMAEDFFHLKTEWVDRMAKRGVSDYFSVANDIPGTKKLLRNLREGATIQSAIAFIREHPEGTTPTRMGGPINPNNQTRSGVITSSIQMDGPRVVDVSPGLHYIPGPISDSGKSSVLVDVLQAGLRNIGSRWQMPEGLVSGDASNNNLASALVAEAPFTKALTSRQWFYRNKYMQMLKRVLDRAGQNGLLGAPREDILEVLGIDVSMPPMAARKLKEETEIANLLHEQKIISKSSWAAREGLVYDEERTVIDREEEEHPEDDEEPMDEQNPEEALPTTNEGERV